MSANAKQKGAIGPSLILIVEGSILEVSTFAPVENGYKIERVQIVGNDEKVRTWYQLRDCA
jgi:hypothetical protein